MGDPQYAKYPDLQLSQHIFHTTNPSSSKPQQRAAIKSIQDAIRENKMAPLYRYLSHPIEGILNAPGEGTSAQPFGLRRASSSASSLLATKRPSLNSQLPWEEELYEELKADNDKELEAIQKEEEEAKETSGETEIQSARGKRAEFWTRVGDKVRLAVPCTMISTLKADSGHRRKRYQPSKLSSSILASSGLRSTSSYLSFALAYSLATSFW